MDPVLAFTRDDTVYFYQVFIYWVVFLFFYNGDHLKIYIFHSFNDIRLILMTKIDCVVVLYKRLHCHTLYLHAAG